MNAATKQDPWLKQLARKPMFWGIVAIVILLILNIVKDPAYLSISVSDDGSGRLAGNLIDILRVSAPILMIALGMSLVIATSGIDLSVGSVMAAAGAASMQFLHSAGDGVGNAFAALGIAVALGAVLGAINGALVAYVGLQPFISTLVMMMAARGLSQVITDGQNTKSVNSVFAWVAKGYIGIPVVFVLAILIVVIVGLVVRRSALGLMVEAIGINAEASRMAGVKPRPILVMVYVLSGLLAAIAGVFAVGSVMTVDVGSTGTGYQLEMDAILAVVVGGTSLAGGKFSINGAVVGALLIATLNKTILFLGIPSSATPAFKAAVIIVLCLAQSDSIRGWFTSRKFPQTPQGPKVSAPAKDMSETAVVKLGESEKGATA